MAQPNQVTEYLMESRILRLENMITERVLKDLRDRMLYLQMKSEEEPINLEIDCGGGETFPTLHFCDFLELRLRAPVHAVVTGFCGSSATFILLHCAKKLGFPHSRYLIHSSEMGGVALKTNPASRTVREQLNADLEATHELVTQMYMKKLSISRKKVEKLTLRGEQLFNESLWATEALEVGLIEGIVTEIS